MNAAYVVVTIPAVKIVQVYQMVMQNLMNVEYAMAMVLLKDISAMGRLKFLLIINQPFRHFITFIPLPLMVIV